ncbi:MAG: hypothetical protein ACFFBD_08005 [Candidatus Hodarchaeota archaeon]
MIKSASSVGRYMKRNRFGIKSSKSRRLFRKKMAISERQALEYSREVQRLIETWDDAA